MCFGAWSGKGLPFDSLNWIRSIWFSKLSKEIRPNQCGWTSPNPLVTRLEQKAHYLIPSWAGASIFSCLRPWSSWFPGIWTLELIPSALPVLRPLDFDLQHWFSGLWIQTGTTPPVFLSLHLTDGRLCDFLASIGAWAKSYNKSPVS